MQIMQIYEGTLNVPTIQKGNIILLLDFKVY